MKRTLLISAALATLAVASPALASHRHHATQSITPLFSIPAQHRHSITPRIAKPRNYVCATGSLGDQLCCIWHITYPGYGFGTWNDCVVVPSWAAPTARRNNAHELKPPR